MNLEFRNFMEGQYELTGYIIFEGRGSSSGSYGGGDYPEVAARDPRIGVNFDLSIDHRYDPYLQGKEVHLVDEGQGGSYHEAWWDGYAGVMLGGETIEQFEQNNLPVPYFFDHTNPSRERRRSKPKVTIIKYTNIREVLIGAIKAFKLQAPYHFYHDEFKVPHIPDDIDVTHKDPKNAPEPGESSEEYWKRLIGKTWLPKSKDQWEGD